jgi:hypothetical protein
MIELANTARAYAGSGEIAFSAANVYAAHVIAKAERRS